MPGVTTAYQSGNHAGRPAATAGCILYSCTEHGLVYRSNGAAWSTWLTLGGGAPAAHAASHEAGGSDEIDVTGLVGAGGGGGGWELLVDEDMSSLANFTVETGTWAIGGGVTQQTGTGANARLRYNNKVRQGGPTIYEIEVRQPSAGQTGGAAGTGAGILSHHTSGAATNSTIYELEHNGTNGNIVSMEQSGVAVVRQHTLAAAIPFNTWCKLRQMDSGQGQVELWVDGVHVANGSNTARHGGASPDFLGLYTYTCLADFRNFKVWGLTLP